MNIVYIIAITITILISFVGFFGPRALIRWWNDRRRRTTDETSSEMGFSVELDCRACRQLNRVPSHRLRDRPRCGRCKARLMPGRRVVLCRLSPMGASLSAELDSFWRDEDRLWQCLADHVERETEARAEAGSRPQKVS
jgi:Thioredoxin 2, N-terminal